MRLSIIGLAIGYLVFGAGCSAFKSSNRPGSDGGSGQVPAADCPSGTGNTVAFTWVAPVISGTLTPDPSVQGYNFYYGRESGRYTVVEGAANTAHVVTPLGTGTYYFAVTAYNAVGESRYSNEVAWTGVSCPSLRNGKVQYISLGSGASLKNSRPQNIQFDGNSFDVNSSSDQKAEKADRP